MNYTSYIGVQKIGFGIFIENGKKHSDKIIRVLSEIYLDGSIDSKNIMITADPEEIERDVYNGSNKVEPNPILNICHAEWLNPKKSIYIFYDFSELETIIDANQENGGFYKSGKVDFAVLETVKKQLQKIIEKLELSESDYTLQLRSMPFSYEYYFD